METKLPMCLFSLMRHNAKAQNVRIWIMPLDQMDELLFSGCVVETGSLVRMGRENAQNTPTGPKPRAGERWSC